MDFEMNQHKQYLSVDARDRESSTTRPSFDRPSEYDAGHAIFDGNHNTARTPSVAKKHNPITSIVLAYFVGLLLTVASFFFLRWLSQQVTQCPAWAINCEVKSATAFILQHLGLVQGIVSTIYHLGLTCMAYGACKLAETSIWPILTRQTLTLAKLDNILLATRGSLAHAPQASLSAGKGITVIIILCVAVILSLKQVESILVGYAFTPQNVSVEYRSQYYPGGGTGLPFRQASPPGPLPVAMTLASGLYTSWSNGLSEEPMPLGRDYLVDRLNLSQIGSFQVGAIKASKAFECSSQRLEIVSDVPDVSEAAIGILTFNVSATRAIATVRLQPRMTLWVDSIEYVNATSSISTIVFAAINGTIEGGSITLPTARMSGYGYTGISAVSCRMEVALEDDHLNIGGGGASDVTTSSLATFGGPGQYFSPYGPLGDVAVWLAVAITGYGTSVWGTQPMFEMPSLDSPSLTTPGIVLNGTNSLQLPLPYTSTLTSTDGNDWTLATLLNFIMVGSGALAITMCRQWLTYPVVTIASSSVVLQLETARTYALLGPMIAISALVAVLLSTNIWLHSRARMPRRQLMGVVELVYHSQSESIKAAAQQIHARARDAGGMQAVSVGFTAHVDSHPGLDSRST